MPATRQLRLALTVVLAPALLCVAAPAQAGRGGKPPRGGSATISLVLLESTDGLAHWGQKVSFKVATTATTMPYVNLKCYQAGKLVSDGWESFFEGLDDQIMGLASPAWTPGEAECTADVTKPDRTVLGSMSFHVYA